MSRASIVARADTIAAKLAEYEALLCDTHTTGIRLSLSLRQIQEAAGLRPTDGRKIFARLDAAQAQISGAMEAAAAAHTLLHRAVALTGLDPLAYGETKDEDAEYYRSRGALTPEPAIA